MKENGIFNFTDIYVILFAKTEEINFFLNLF